MPPKTASNAIKQTLEKHGVTFSNPTKKTNSPLIHLKLTEIVDLFEIDNLNEYKIFQIVRNPYDRFVSSYFHQMRILHNMRSIKFINYDLNEFFNHKLPNYKTQAAFYTLLEMYNTTTPINPEYIITNKVTILEHLTAAPIAEKKVRENILEEFRKEDKDTRILTYRIILEKFNGKYNELNKHQKLILKELINSIDNTPRLKEFYISKSKEIKKELTTLNNKTKDPVTKIKINEITSLIKPVDKNYKVTDNDLVDLLQYCDLLTELETVNA